MNTATLAEHALMKEVIMPFLKEHWYDIDQPEYGTSWIDGRLTRDELMRAYHSALNEERPADAWVIGEILKRYETICQSHEDGYWWKEEPVLGISEQDISVYEQLASMPREANSPKPRPRRWL